MVPQVCAVGGVSAVLPDRDSVGFDNKEGRIRAFGGGFGADIPALLYCIHHIREYCQGTCYSSLFRNVDKYAAITANWYISGCCGGKRQFEDKSACNEQDIECVEIAEEKV